MRSLLSLCTFSLTSSLELPLSSNELKLYWQSEKLQSDSSLNTVSRCLCTASSAVAFIFND